MCKKIFDPMLTDLLNTTSRKRPKIKPSKLKHFWLGSIFGLFRLDGLSRPVNIGSKICLHRIVQHTLSYQDIHLSHSASDVLRLYNSQNSHSFPGTATIPNSP